jgi:hypothetical protein
MVRPENHQNQPSRPAMCWARRAWPRSIDHSSAARMLGSASVRVAHHHDCVSPRGSSRRVPGLPRHVGEVVGVLVPHHGHVVAIGQALAAVVGQGEQQPVAAAAVGDDERLVGETTHDVGHGLGGQVVVRAHGVGRFEGATVGEHREPLEDLALVVEQEVVAPVGHRPQRLLAGQRRTGAAREQPKAVVEALGELVDGEGEGPSGGQLDGERHAVEPGAQVGDRFRGWRR